MLVFLHGATLDHRMWHAQVDALSKTMEVIAPDLPGCGIAQRDRSGAANPAREVLDRIDRAATIDVVGLSFGGSVATEIAILEPERVRNLILIDALLLGENPKIPGLSDAVGAAKAGDVARARSLWLSSGLFDRLSGSERALAEQMVADCGLPQWRGTLRHEWAFEEHREHLAKIRARTLVLVGNNDLETFRAMANTYAESIPNARLQVIDGGGHMLPMEMPDAVNTVLTDFLRPAF